MSFVLRIGATALALLLISFDVRASCIEDPRPVQLDAGTIRIKSYSCGITAGSSSGVRVEFHRLSSAVASVVAQGRSSKMLDRALGKFRIARNEVIANYLALQREFGTTYTLGENNPVQLTVETAGQGGSATPGDSISGDSISLLVSGGRSNYPAFDEIASLRRAVIPNNLKFYYAGSLATRAKRYYWRGFSNDDLSKYLTNLTSYNKMMGLPPASTTYIPEDLKLARHLAGSDWPSDFVLLIGHYVTPEDTQQMCGGEPGWSFEYWTRPIIMEVMLVENTSSAPIRLNGMVGRRVAENRLHALNTSPGPAHDQQPIGPLSENLMPGEKLIVPTKIVLPAQLFPAREWENTNDIYRRIGANQFTGNTTGHAVPSLKNYAFGPELVVSGIVVDGQRIDFSQRSANFFDITISSLEGSCPYLLLWNSSQEKWHEHGKVLHKAQGSAKEETETLTLSGFVSRFRFEEREPEIAHIDFAGLSIALKNGTTIELVSNNQALSARDGNYLSLAWGQALEFGFQLPDGVEPVEVIESRLNLAGYYDRYPSPSALTLEDIVSRRDAGAARLSKSRSFCPLPILPIANTRPARGP
jgi:hypothetical protein